MREIVATKRIIIPLGKQGENQATVVKFPVENWDTIYGAGAFELLNVRPSENTPYTCSITVDDQFVRWVVQAADVAIVGHGYCELTYVVDGVVAKSLTFETCVLESIEGAGTVPPPYKSRIHDLIEASANISIEADRAEDAANAAWESAAGASDSAEAAAGSAQQAAESVEAAEQAVSDAQQAVEDAGHQSDTAEGYAKTAESWAVGGTGTRQGEDVNNSKFWAEMAQQQAEMSGYIFAFVNEETGRLEITVVGDLADDFDASINQSNGHLEVRIRNGE